MTFSRLPIPTLEIVRYFHGIRLKQTVNSNLSQDNAGYFSTGPAIMREMSRIPDVAFQAQKETKVCTSIVSW